MTTLTAYSIASLLLFVPNFIGDDEIDYEKRLEETAWKWDEKQADANYYAKTLEGKYTVRVKSTNEKFPWSDVDITISADDEIKHSFKAHKATPFVVKGNVLYVAEYLRSRSGCELSARDLDTGKELWKVPLQGMGPISHFRYNNAVAMKVDETGAIVVFGKETVGHYIEFVNPSNGKTMAHKKSFNNPKLQQGK